MRLEINNKGKKKKSCRNKKHVETKQYVTKQPMDHWRTQKKKSKCTGRQILIKSNNANSMWCSKRVLRGKFIANTSLLQEIRKSSNNQPNFRPKGTRKRRKDKT